VHVAGLVALTTSATPPGCYRSDPQHSTAVPMVPWSFRSFPLGGHGGSSNTETTRPLPATGAFETKPLQSAGSPLLISGGRASARPQPHLT